MGPPLLPGVCARWVVSAAGRIRRPAETCVLVCAIYRHGRGSPTPPTPVERITRHTVTMPELPEVEQLVLFLQERAVGHTVAAVSPVAINVLKPYQPSPSALGGLTVLSVTRHGKFLDLDIDGLHLVI